MGHQADGRRGGHTSYSSFLLHMAVPTNPGACEWCPIGLEKVLPYELFRVGIIENFVFERVGLGSIG